MLDSLAITGSLILILITHACVVERSNSFCGCNEDALCLWLQEAAYGGTFDLVHKEFKDLGIAANMIDISAPTNTWEQLLQPNTKVGSIMVDPPWCCQPARLGNCCAGTPGRWLVSRS